MTAVNWPLLILTDSPEFPGKLTIAEMVKMCGNEDKVTNKRFDGHWGNWYTWDLPYSNIFLLSEYHLFYLVVNLTPYGFLLISKTFLLFSSKQFCQTHVCMMIKLTNIVLEWQNIFAKQYQVSQKKCPTFDLIYVENDCSCTICYYIF